MSKEKIFNEEEVGIKVETLITFGKAKLSDLFIVIGSNEEAEFEKMLPEDWLENLKENLADKDPELIPLVNTNKIKVFFSRNCIKIIGEVPVFTKYILDHRKFAYPKVATPKTSKSLKTN